MKKFMAIVLTIVMAFSVVAMPASAAYDVDNAQANVGTVVDSSKNAYESGKDLYDSLASKDFEGSVGNAFTFAKVLSETIHNIVHSFAEMFDFDCPFCSENVEVAPEEPSESEKPAEPSEPVEIVPDEDWYETQSSYIIKTAEEFAAFAQAVNSGISFAGEIVALAADIDLGGKIWNPIGNFDSNDYTISNLYINAPEGEGVALFGVAENATIEDVNIKNVDITGYEMVAAVVGYASVGCTISDCHVSGDINIVAGYTHVGGITSCGYADIDNCSVIADEMGKITAVERNGAGGIIGWIFDGKNDITNCQVKNMEISAWTNVGAISGFANYSNTIDGCSAENVVLTKTRVGGHPAIGLAAGGFNYSASKAITVTNNTFKDITLIGESVTVSSANLMYGSEYSGKLASNFVMENNIAENINLGFLYN